MAIVSPALISRAASAVLPQRVTLRQSSRSRPLTTDFVATLRVVIARPSDRSRVFGFSCTTPTRRVSFFEGALSRFFLASTMLISVTRFLAPSFS